MNATSHCLVKYTFSTASVNLFIVYKTVSESKVMPNLFHTYNRVGLQIQQCDTLCF